MPPGPDHRHWMRLLLSSAVGRLNIAITRPADQTRQKVMRDALKGSVTRLLDAPRFSTGVVNNGDLTWKGRNVKPRPEAEPVSEEGPEYELYKEQVSEEAASGQDWSSVGYDPRYRTIRRLNEQEELRFVALAKVGDRFAQQKLVVHHLPLLKMVARRYAGKGLALSELVNEGTFGLVRAIERFDLGRELRFGTYARWWIRDAMEQALLKQSRMIRLPGHVVRNMREQQRAEEQEAARAGLGIDSESSDGDANIDDLHQGGAGSDGGGHDSSMSMDRGGDDASWDDRREAKVDGMDETTPEMILDDKQRKEFLIRGLMQLSERERVVLVRRFGLHSEEPETLEEVAADLGVSYERVRQIQKTALTKLRAYLGPHCASTMW